MGETLDLTVTFPGDKGNVRLPAKLCHRRDTGDYVLYGVDYSEITSRSMEMAVEDIESYVMQRQREELRSRQ